MRSQLKKAITAQKCATEAIELDPSGSRYGGSPPPLKYKELYELPKVPQARLLVPTQAPERARPGTAQVVAASDWRGGEEDHDRGSACQSGRLHGPDRERELRIGRGVLFSGVTIFRAGPGDNFRYRARCVTIMETGSSRFTHIKVSFPFNLSSFNTHVTGNALGHGVGEQVGL